MIGGVFVLVLAGTTRSYPIKAVKATGLVRTSARPGSQSRAKQYWGLAGRWEGLPFPWEITGMDETGSTMSLPPVVVVPAEETESARAPKVSTGEGDRAVEMNEGSLSLCIVALEKRGTYPKDPPSSQGGGQIIGSLCGTYAWTPEP